ncbi:MAG: GFA family protein [Lysobacter sp.]|nr:MAG: GFA family protein [Lysobacter sp.]
MNAPQFEYVTYRGGCHCGRVRYEVDAPRRLEVLDCNCSICRMTGFLHLIVPVTRFRLLADDDALLDYRFNTGTARHRFCATCGIKSFYVPRSHPDGIDVNARCLDDAASLDLCISLFDDSRREAATAAIAHLARVDT